MTQARAIMQYWGSTVKIGSHTETTFGLTPSELTPSETQNIGTRTQPLFKLGAKQAGELLILGTDTW